MSEVLLFIAGLVFGAIIVRLLLAARFSRELLTQEQEKSQLRESLALADNRSQSLQQELAQMQQQQAAAQQRIEQLQSAAGDYQAQIAALNTLQEQQALRHSEKIQLLVDAREQLNQEFQLLAQKVFNEGAEQFNQRSRSTLDLVVNPLKEQLKDFRQKVEDIYDKDSKERVSLSGELAQLKALNQRMSDEALNLTRALKGDNKAQGNWGEMVLERILEESGLHKGREYDTQVSLVDDQGRRRAPDVVVRLPDNKDIVIDSKVSLIHYERYCNAQTDSEKALALKQHIQSVRDHITQLSLKDYESLDGLRTLDFVFIFIPIEAAFLTAFEHDSQLFREAYEKNIIVVGPTNLLATLRTIQSIWRYERQNKNAEEIARQAGALHDKFVGFIADLDDVAKHLQRASESQQNAVKKLSSGRGNLVASTLRLEKLGAKVKRSLPEALRQDNDDALVTLDESAQSDDQSD